MLQNRLHRWLVLGVFLVLSFAVTHIIAQMNRPRIEDPITDALREAEHGDFSGGAATILANANYIKAVPLLEQQFQLSRDESVKGQISSALVRLHDRKPIYWDYLVQQAESLLKDGPPMPFYIDSSGKASSEQLAPNFLAWAKSHNLQEGEAYTLALEVFPERITNLAITRDRRALPVLRRFLRSENAIFVGTAGLMLAQLHDKGSIATLIAVCKSASPAVRQSVALALLAYQDPAVTKEATGCYTTPK